MDMCANVHVHGVCICVRVCDACMSEEARDIKSLLELDSQAVELPKEDAGIPNKILCMSIKCY